MSIKRMTRFKRGLLKRPLIGLLVFLAGGCSHLVREPKMPVEIPASFSASGTEPVPDKWWQAFGDEVLADLVEQALTNNFNLQTAWDRLAQAKAVARKTGSALSPEAVLTAGGSRTRREEDNRTTYSTLYFVGAAASYELDLWSRLKSTQKAALLDVEAQRDATDTAAITLAASIASTWYRLAEAKALVRIAQQQIEANRQVLKIVTVKFRKSLARAADVLRQRQLVASTEAQLIAAQERAQLLQYTLSVLIGDQPKLKWQQTAIDLPDLPPAPDLGGPAEVLWRRPDVRRAYRQVQAADQRVAAAIADQYPRLSLSASAETSSASVRDLFDDWLASLAANAIQPLFDGAQRRAEVEHQEAIVSEAIHAWGQSILDALQDVEAALKQQQQQTRLLESLRLQLHLARQTYERNRESYISAQVGYIRVLESLQSLQELERQVVASRRALIEHRIDLYRSTAGQWDLPQPARAQITDATRTEQNSGTTIQDK